MAEPLPAVVSRAQVGSALAGRQRPAAPADELGEEGRAAVVDTLIRLLEGLYAHLPLKRAMYAIDPVQRLRLLRQRVAVTGDAELHAEVAAVLTSLRDAHTRYVGPASLEGRVAALPFLVEAYGEAGHRRYVVSKIAAAWRQRHDPAFEPGVELLQWNAVPVDRAVDLYADRETGGRPDARRSRALTSLTVRPLQYLPAPDEDWVLLGYRDRDGHKQEVRVDWRVLTPGRALTALAAAPAGRRVVAADPAAELARRARKLLYAPEQWHAERRPQRPAAPAAGGGWIPTALHDAVAAREVTTRAGRLGYLRLWSFDVADDQAFVEEIARLLQLLPETGLVVDLRSNPGGLVWAAERMLQLMTPNRIRPTRFSFVATALTRAMVNLPQNEDDLEPWRDSVGEALATGELYSRAVPLTPEDRANDTGQVYAGPVVAVADANTYSAADLFAAGFVDNEVGVLVGVDDATGGGGANVWDVAEVRRSLAGSGLEPAELPGGVGFTIAARRATRSADGATIEDAGVRAQDHYPLTRRDLMDGNHGLLNHCGELLREQARSALLGGSEVLDVGGRR
ncbi:MAG TPA: S41 family peptidase [Acidimicrobiales bacterium]|nr:S41 family peptidase [Acidimicrobiales bacterium]